MKTSHLISLFVEPTEGNELELRATVSLVAGTRDEFEVEWLGDTSYVDGLSRVEEKALEQRAREAWFDVMAELDQPTEEDERGDWEERREDDNAA